MDKGNDLKSAITASYKLPTDTDYNTFTPKQIDTSHKGQINFTLPTSALISTGEITTIRVQIDFGQILDHLDLGPTFDYTKLIPNASSNTYEFNGALTSHSYFTNYPVETTKGYTKGGKAIE
ncbi:hypothetical protein IL308_13330 [Lactococcus lactis]|uniref:hypothetical protein n=1 Tax=Lactococcus lactis TaxID=1358 RepID=UPI0019143512|nr:hypothetical protein [Lactococcus lactis]MBK5077714.1 hypothetical protein [Lactococcus lactis]